MNDKCHFKTKSGFTFDNFRGQHTESTRRNLLVLKSNTTELINKKYNQMEKDIYYMILFTSNDQNKQSIEKEGKLVVAQDCWYWKGGIEK